MTHYQFSKTPAVTHGVIRRPGGAQVDDVRVPVQDVGGGHFVAVVDGRRERLQAATHGDAVFVQLRGRAWRVDRLDPTRSAVAAPVAGAGVSLAPMPGVVISLQSGVGQPVRAGAPLLVIESMKLQLTIEATADGVVMELPFAVGQTFQRGAVLVRTAAEAEAKTEAKTGGVAA
ncbi:MULTISPECIES: acetyl-CoA carboxylase biotin carboxyl carrier protein subunit [unclassified Variovorax]|uniref:acetyl-CoA carboxylase biotin carboxyl carrier protein subunit n=1 Tax=unclassified Variovorax TaxID=663243 RepID=UPI003F44BF2C